MKSRDDRSEQAAKLRRQAEEIAREKAALARVNIDGLSAEEIRLIFHDLQVHQIELEMQNEEMRRVHVELDAVRARYFDLYDLAPVGYCTLSEKGLILEANITAANILAAARGMLVKQPFSHFILREDQDSYYLHCRQCLKEGTPQSYELRMLKMDGATFWAHLATTSVEDVDGSTLYRIVISDITDHKRVEEALQESEERYRNVFKNHAAVKLLIDPDTGSIVEANEAAVNYYGWPQEQLRQMKIQEISTLSPEDIRKELDKIHTGEQIHFEFKHRRADGSIRDVEVFSSKIEVKGKDILHSIIHDITDRKQAEEDRNKLILDLREAFSQVRTLSGLLPICASCKKIRDDKGYWSQIESYIKERSDVEFTHGVCPECMKKLYPETYEKHYKEG
jgi:PAS domain S-box-containing protein